MEHNHITGRLQKSRFFFPIWKAQSTVSVILAREARDPHMPVWSLPSVPHRFYTRSKTFVRIPPASLAFAENTVRLFCSLCNT